MASGYCDEQHRSSPFPLLQKVLLDSTVLDKALKKRELLELQGLTWSEKVWVCKGAGLAQVSVWDPPLWDGLEGVPSL